MYFIDMLENVRERTWITSQGMGGSAIGLTKLWIFQRPPILANQNLSDSLEKHTHTPNKMIWHGANRTISEKKNVRWRSSDSNSEIHCKCWVWSRQWYRVACILALKEFIGFGMKHIYCYIIPVEILEVFSIRANSE